jgi:hypothetical protein
MWLGNDGIAVHLTQYPKKKEYLVQKLAIFDLRFDKAISVTSRGRARITPRKI